MAAWYALSWLFRRDNPKLKLFWWLAAAAGVASILALESGWVVTEVGRQPWIVFDYYKVKQAATPNQGVWATFLIILVLYAGVGVTLVLILRRMSRRWREQSALADTETEVPYGPPEPIPVASTVDEQEPVTV